MKNKYFAFVGLLSVLFIMTGCTPPQEDSLPKACSEEAKICPDGSTVGRIGPQCEFTPCSIIENEKIFLDSVQNIQFLYVDPFPEKFITPVNWPPSVSISDEKFSCKDGGSEIQITGESMQKNLGGNNYCLTVQSEGAAGSTYTTYKYVTTKAGALVTFDFALRFVQCYNYSDPQKTECTKERETFDSDALVIRMEESLQFLKK